MLKNSSIMNKFDSVIKQLYRKQYSVIIQLDLVQDLFCDSWLLILIIDLPSNQ